MPRICVEVIGGNCKYCFELENCTTLQEVVDKLVHFCRVFLDLESAIYLVNGRAVNGSTRVCSDSDIKVVRVLKGGRL